MKSMCRVGSVVLVLGALATLSWAVSAAEAKPSTTVTPAANIADVVVPIYKSRVLTTRTAVKRISVGNPEIADILITSPTQLYLLGRSLGSTNVLLWDGSNRLIDSLDLEVVHDLSGLKSKLHQILPNEAIEVFSAQGALVLRGQVSSAAVMDSALKLARTYTNQVETLKRYRSEGKQVVRVERVTVNEGGQAVVGDVSYRRGEDDEK